MRVALALWSGAVIATMLFGACESDDSCDADCPADRCVDGLCQPLVDGGRFDAAEDASVDAVMVDVERVDGSPGDAADAAMSDDGGADAEEPDAGPRSTTRTFNVWVWNVAGNFMHGGRTDDGLIDAAVSSIINRDADFVGFNELCVSQYRAIQDALRARGWPDDPDNFSRFAEALSARPGLCQNTGYGNAIFSREPLGGALRLTLPSDGRTEDRNLLCAPLADLPTMRWCTTHISTSSEVGDDGLAANVRQLIAVQEQLDAFHAAGETVVIGGDFNAQPHYRRLDRFYAPSVDTAVNGDNRGVHRELDDTDPVCLGHGERSVADPTGGPCDTGVRIDHIFAREDELVGTYSSDTLSISEACDGPCSDHRIVIGEATLRILDP